MRVDKELKPQWKAFADYYIELGNAEKAAINAGYSAKYARGNAHKLVANSCISQYIAQRMKQIEDKRIAKAEEVMQFFTSTMRGEVKDQFGLDPTLSDRLDAAKQLQKRYGLDKVALVGGEVGDGPIKTENVVQVYLPDNGRGKNDS